MKSDLKLLRKILLKEVGEGFKWEGSSFFEVRPRFRFTFLRREVYIRHGYTWSYWAFDLDEKEMLDLIDEVRKYRTKVLELEERIDSERARLYPSESRRIH